MDAEVGVVGVGTMGSMTLWQLAKHGISVVGFEQFGIGHDRSAAGGDTRVFRTAYKEGKEYVPLLKKSLDLWHELEKETRRELFTKTKGAMIGNPDTKEIKNVIKSAKEYNLDYEILDHSASKKYYPQFKLLDDEVMIIDHQSGILRAQLSTVSAVQKAVELGANLLTEEKVTKIKTEENSVLIYTNKQKYRFKQVIVSSGPWLKKLFPELKHFIEIRRLLNFWFIPEDINRFSYSHFPVFIRQSKGQSFYGIPPVSGEFVKVALAGESKDKLNDPDGLNRNIDDEDISSISEVIKEYFTGLLHYPSRAKAYMETYTKDRHPIIGRIPNKDNVIVLGGFSGHGFKLAPVVGKIAADLIINDGSDYLLDLFSTERI